jgi:hypothetical protein
MRPALAGIVASFVLLGLGACSKETAAPTDGGTAGTGGAQAGGGAAGGTAGLAGGGGAGGGVSGGGGAGGAGTGGVAGGDGGLTWFTTCGDPVCRGAGEDAHRAMPDVAPCTTQAAGQPCTTKDELCDPRGQCNEALRCSDHDPKMQPGGCPISSRRFKTEIAYVSDGERLQISEEVAKLRLARYKYKDDPGGRPHLGFILEDAPDSPAADMQRERVDLYAYLSMVVATLQTQRQQLDSQKQELGLLRGELMRLRKSAGAGVSATRAQNRAPIPAKSH